MVSLSDKVRENLVRRAASRRGFTLAKSRRRDPMAVDYGLWSLTRDGSVGEFTLSLEEVEAAVGVV